MTVTVNPNHATAAASNTTFTPFSSTKSVMTLPKGNTFYQFMTRSDGLKSSFDKDAQATFKVADKATFQAATAKFEPGVYKKIVALFKDGQAGIDTLVSSLQGQSFSPASFASDKGVRDTLQKLLKNPSELPLDVLKVTPMVAMASGAGVLVKLDANNFYYNYGYKPSTTDPVELAKAVKSGRNFMTSPGHGARDTSDTAYLTDLGSLMGPSNKDPSAFYDSLFQTLAQCDPSGISKLSDLGQTVATDFVGVYTAELARNIMDPHHKWENDLGEVTLLAAYGCAAGKVAKGGKLVDGDPKDYFGVGTNGSGIGETRNDRQALQRAVTDAERKLNPTVVSALDKLIGTKPGDDVMHGLMSYLNDASNQSAIQKNGAQLAKAATAFLSAIRDDATKITAEIEKNGLTVRGGHPPTATTAAASDAGARGARFLGRSTPSQPVARAAGAGVPHHPSTVGGDGK